MHPLLMGKAFTGKLSWRAEKLKTAKIFPHGNFAIYGIYVQLRTFGVDLQICTLTRHASEPKSNATN